MGFVMDPHHPHMYPGAHPQYYGYHMPTMVSQPTRAARERKKIQITTLEGDAVEFKNEGNSVKEVIIKNPEVTPPKDQENTTPQSKPVITTSQIPEQRAEKKTFVRRKRNAVTISDAPVSTPNTPANSPAEKKSCSTK